MNTTRPTIAAFDFDGTLTYSDTLLPFLRFCVGTPAFMKNLLVVAPASLVYLSGRDFRQAIKERVLAQFLGGRTIADVEQLGALFARDYIPRHLRPNALARLRWHQAQGHHCVLVSATLDVYLEPWATSVGFHDVICSRLATDDQGRVTGCLIGKNCWGEEKARHLHQLLGPREEYSLYAYGDSKGDQALLEMADHPFFRQMPSEEVE